MAKYNPDTEPVIVCDPTDPDRRTGRSTRQLKRLPQGAWFFSHNVEYHQHLARSNGRWDIKVIHISMLERPQFNKIERQRVIACDVDHDIELNIRWTNEQRKNFEAFQQGTALP